MKSISRIVVSFLVIYMAASLRVPVAASFWVKGVAFRYSPDYGDLGEGLDKVKPYYDTPQILESGTGRAFAVGYDFGNWGLMLDVFSFEGKADYYHLRLPEKFFFRTSTSPILLSLVYRVSMGNHLHPYLGAGIGTFPSELKITSNVHKGMQEKDSPTGFQVLVGAEYEVKNGLFLSGEVKYLSAKAEYSGYRCIESCSTDWSGIFFSIGIGYRFSHEFSKSLIEGIAF